MNITKKIFIYCIMVLMLFVCINATCASDTFDANLTNGNATDSLSVYVVNSNQDKLSTSSDTYMIDGNGYEDYTKTSDAVGVTDGGETILTQNSASIVINNVTYKSYFDDSGKLVSSVPDGAILDFQGLFVGEFPVYIDKSVNVVSSTEDALFDAGDTYAGNDINSFNINKGGDNTNITGLKFINYCLYIVGASNVTVDGVSIVANKSGVGRGTGFLSIHSGASNTLVKNSYFENGGTGSSLLVLGKGGSYATFDHNLFNITGASGNILSANQYVGTGKSPEHTTYTNNILYNNRPASAFCYAMTVSGSGNLVENNTIYHNGNGIINQDSASSSDNVYRNNSVYGTATFNPSANSLVENNRVQGVTTISAGATVKNNNFTIVKIAGENAFFTNNDVAGNVTVSANNNVIKENNIVSTSDYAVDLGTTTGNTVTDNYLVSSLYKGDFAVTGDLDNNVVINNTPVAPVVVDADTVWIGNNATVTVTVANSTGNVTITVNGKNQTVALVDGVVTVEIASEDLVLGENPITVNYDGPDYPPVSVEDSIVVVDGVITNSTYKYYFDDDGNLVSVVPDGVTLDFQGLFLGEFPVYIDKAVNVVSSTDDALFDAGATYAGNDVNSFNVVAGGDNTNITGLEFINYCLYIVGASNVTVDGVSIVANKSGVGRGTGFLSIHSGASNTLVKNSYFENGGTGSSLLVLGKGGSYATFDHNLFNITGASGNILSANQYVGTGKSPEHTTYTNNILYNNRPASAFCYAMTVSGSGNLVENNTIYHNGNGIINQYETSSSDNVYRNNSLYGTATFNPSANSLVENNNVQGVTTISAGATVKNNNFTTVKIAGENACFTNNDVAGNVTVSANNTVIKENNIISTTDYAIDLGNTTGNKVTGNELISPELYGDFAVKGDLDNNIVELNYPFEAKFSVSVDNITVGKTANINISINNCSEGSVNVIVDGRNYAVDINDGVALLEVPNLKVSTYTVGVTYDGSKYVAPGECIAEFTVSKLQSEAFITTSDLIVDTDVNVTVTIPGATGSVTLMIDDLTKDFDLIDGVATYTIESIEAGNHSINVVYPGDSTHDFVINSTKFTINKLDTILTAKYDNSSENIVATVKDAKGNPVSGLKVGFDVDGMKYVVSDANGQANYSTKDLPAKKYSVQVMAYGNEIYENSNNETVIFDLSKISTTLNVSDITVTYNSGKNFVATLKDANGNVISGAEVTIKLGTITKTLTTDNKGQVSLSLDGIIPDTYAAAITFDGDDTYAASNASAKVTINKVQAKIYLRNALYFVLQTKMVKITLWDANNNPIAGKTVYINLDEYGLKYSGVTDKDGNAYIRVGVGFGNHPATVSFEGDDIYNADSKTGMVRVIKETPSLMLPGAYTKFKATDVTKTIKVYLKDRYNKPLLPGTKVFVKINGQQYVGSIDVNGIASINLNLNEVGVYDIELYYTGNTAYNEVRKTTKITIV